MSGPLPQSESDESSLEIAIVGMAGRFPGARTVDEYWANLVAGRCARVELSDEDLRSAGLDESQLGDPNLVRAAYLLDDSDGFDASFFGYSPRDAELMDPQHRILLECSYSALEDAGHDPSRDDGLVGVYAGAGFNSYLFSDVIPSIGIDEVMVDKRVGIGNRHDFLSTKVSYKLGLQGPSINVQSACSTSLVAVAQACQGLLDFQCDLALAGGVAVNPTRRAGYLYRPDGLFSPDGYCRTFDAQARGTVAGEGVGVVVLKRLQDALDAKDYIYAVIRGSAVNNDGAQRNGFTAPSAVAQAAVIRTALASADVAASSIRYIEVHGVATILGDPIEVSGLRSVYADVPKRHTVLGSAKTNIGHLDTAAGVAGLIKAALVVARGVIPPTLHFREANPRIDLDDGPFQVVSSLTPWPDDGAPRRAAVSSFGMGGTNAHVILQQPPSRAPRRPDGREHVLLLSARSARALDDATDRLHDHLRTHPDLAIEDVAFTLSRGRRELPFRRAVVCTGISDAVDALGDPDGGRLLSAHAGDAGPIGFLFAGVGAEFPGMAHQLYRDEPVFRRAFDWCADLAVPLLGLDIRQIALARGAKPSLAASAKAIFGLPGPSETGDGELHRPSLAYAAVLAVEYALVQLWADRGVVPSALLGHSLGEYVAATIAGVFSLPDAMRLVVERGLLIERQAAGAMLAVPLSVSEAEAFTDDQVSIAAVNGPGVCILSGQQDAVERVAHRLDDAGHLSRRLPTAFGYHSPMMDPVIEPYREVLRTVQMHAPTIPLVSNVTGTWITDDDATDIEYWAMQMRRPVLFADGLQTLWSVADVSFVEVGPGPTLSAGALQHPSAPPSAMRVAVCSLPGRFTPNSDRYSMLTAATALWLTGRPAAFGKMDGWRVPLPGYPFERTVYRLRARSGVPAAHSKTAIAGSGRSAAEDDWFYSPGWERRPAAARPDRGGLGTGRWLVFADGYGVGMTLANRLRALGAAVVTVSPSIDWQDLGGVNYGIDPRNSAHLSRLVGQLRTAGGMPDRVVHCWGVNESDEEDGASTPVQELDFGFVSLARWARESTAELVDRPQRWDIVTTGAHAVTGDERLTPASAAAAGFASVAAQEYPLLECSHVDFVAPARGSFSKVVDEVVDYLIDDLAVARPDATLARRGRHIWAPTYTRTQLSASRPLVRNQGVYLITGGLGRIGLIFARALAESQRVHLVLLGRHGVPNYDGYADAASVRHIHDEIRTLENLASSVSVVCADVADEVRMAEVVESVVAKFGRIDGVVHCAGTTGPAAHSPLSEITDEQIGSHLRPKVVGVSVLDAVLTRHHVDFAILCSSVAAILGGVGFASYAAANAVLDATAQTSTGLPWTSVTWEGWAFPDAAQLEEQDSAVRLRLMTLALTPDQGRRVIDRLLSSVLPSQVVVSTAEFSARVAEWSNARAVVEDTTRRYERPNLRNPYVVPATATEVEVAEVWQSLLGVNRVGVNDNFFELGGSSLLGLQIVHRLRHKLAVQVPLTVVYEGPTVRSLAALVDRVRSAE